MKINLKENILQFLILSTIFSVISVGKYLALNSTYFDLGQIIRNLNLIFFEKEYHHIISSFSVIKIFLAQIFFFSEKYTVYILLISQSIILSCPLLFFKDKYFYNAKYLRWLYITHFSVWYFAIFDFHVDVFIIPLYCLFFYFFLKKKYNNCLIVSVLFLTIKDIYIIQAAILIFILYLTKKNRYYLYISFSYLLFFLLVVLYIQPETLREFSSYEYFQCENFASCLEFKLGNFNLDYEKFDIKKFLFIFVILFSFITISYQNNKIIYLILPFILLVIFTNKQNYYSINTHYVLSFMFPLFLCAIKNNNKKILTSFDFIIKNKYFLMIIIIFNLSLSPLFFSLPFFEKYFSSYSYKVYISSERSEIIKNKIKQYIPTDKSYSISTQNNLIFDQLILRPKVFSFPEKVEYEIKQDKVLQADYVLIDLKRRPFLIDDTCNYVKGSCSDINFETKYLTYIENLSFNYDILYEYDGFKIFIHNKLK